MPWSAPKHCPHGHPPFTGKNCPTCLTNRKAASEAKRPNARQRGYGAKWDKTAKAFLAKHTICVVCGQPSQCVDHIIAHKGDMRLFWNRANWQALCIPCNSRKAAKQEGGFGRGAKEFSSPPHRDHGGSVARKILKIGVST